MPFPRLEVPAGVIDGVNVTFTTQFPYIAGTTAVFRNGQLRPATNIDGWLESSPSTGVFDMKEAPLTGDTIQIFYLDSVTSPLDPSDPLGSKVCGKVTENETVCGEFSDTEDLRAELSEVEDIEGIVILVDDC